MNNQEQQFSFGVITQNMFEEIKHNQKLILATINGMNKQQEGEYLTAQEFIDRTSMSRSTFDDKRAKNEITTIKKGRKVYVHISEVKRYFES